MQVWFQNRRAKWRKSERFSQSRAPPSKSPGNENNDAIKSESEIDNSDVAGDISDIEGDAGDTIHETESINEPTFDGNLPNHQKCSVFQDSDTKPDTGKDTLECLLENDTEMNGIKQSHETTSENKTSGNIVTPPKDHSIESLVSTSSTDIRNTLHDNQSRNPGAENRTDSPSLSSGSPSPPMNTSVALNANTRAGLMMHSKPMLQHTFTQTLLALNNNAMNRSSFFPMLDRYEIFLIFSIK